MLSEYLKGNIWRLEDCPFKLYFLLVQHLSFAYVAALSSLLLSPIFFSLFFCNAISKWCSVWLLELKNLIIFFLFIFFAFRIFARNHLPLLYGSLLFITFRRIFISFVIAVLKSCFLSSETVSVWSVIFQYRFVKKIISHLRLRG